MGEATWDRFQFGFTITYHYLFPQLTLGLALLILISKVIAFRRRDPHWDDLARFWARIQMMDVTRPPRTPTSLESASAKAAPAPAKSPERRSAAPRS